MNYDNDQISKVVSWRTLLEILDSWNAAIFVRYEGGQFFVEVRTARRYRFVRESRFAVELQLWRMFQFIASYWFVPGNVFRFRHGVRKGPAVDLKNF